ncbi:MAG: glycosyltransferase family protein [Candidatus Micrarchaeota archaeon]|nr:glycosyltransferase family protein [Candidatus Micrarchaeota archaeon]
MMAKTGVLAIIQARMGSTRLPKKVLADVEGKPMMHWIAMRLKASKKVSKIVVATTTEKVDGQVEEFAKSEGIPCYRGSVNDIVDRCYQAALQSGCGAVVRITADCPLVDPALVDEMLVAFEKGKFDFYSNVEPPSYPDGLDVEILSYDCLERLWKATRDDSFLAEWFRTYLVQNPDKFRLGNHKYKTDLSSLRWTVDEKEDLELVRRIYSELKGRGGVFHMSDVLELLSKEPSIAKINDKYIRDKAYLDALAAYGKEKK